MKTFKEATLKLTSFNLETEEKDYINLRDLKQDAGVTEIEAVKAALATVVVDPITEVETVETFIVG